MRPLNSFNTPKHLLGNSNTQIEEENPFMQEVVFKKLQKKMLAFWTQVRRRIAVVPSVTSQICS